MHKETVTLENIKTDLKDQVKNHCVSLIGDALALVLLLIFACFITYLIVAYFLSDASLSEKFSGLLYGQSFLYLLQLLMSFAATIYFLVAIIKKVRMVMLLRDSLKNEVYIVKDTLVKSDYISRRRGGNIHFLIFSQYGKYIVPYENYSWSSEFCMGAGGVLIHAFEGSEYYLVISKAPYNKILYAYNTSLFELEDSLKMTTPWDNYRY